jgi:hypothetical protein
MEKWKKQVLCFGLIAVLTATPVCYVLLRLGDSISQINTGQISDSLDQVQDRIRNLNGLMAAISESLKSIDLDAFGDRINTTIQRMTVSLDASNSIPRSDLSNP